MFCFELERPSCSACATWRVLVHVCMSDPFEMNLVLMRVSVCSKHVYIVRGASDEMHISYLGVCVCVCVCVCVLMLAPSRHVFYHVCECTYYRG
jgi:hypothetical protein